VRHVAFGLATAVFTGNSYVWLMHDASSVQVARQWLGVVTVGDVLPVMLLDILRLDILLATGQTAVYLLQRLGSTSATLVLS
jgi:hypothetical protein